MRIADVCTRYAADIAPGATIRQAAEQMREHHVGALVVVEQVPGGRRPVGILTDRDLTVSVITTGVDADTLTVGDAMSRDLLTCTIDEDMSDAIARMRKLGVRRLPVVDQAGLLVGMLSADDLLGAIAAELGDITRAFTREQVREIERRT